MDFLLPVSLWFIFVIFGLGILFLELPVWWRNWQLRMVLRRCRAALTNPPETKIEPHELRARVLETLSHLRWLAAPAREFDKTWRETVLATRQAALGEIDLVDFLTPRKVLPRVANRYLATVYPGVLVALGILGTFLGLVLGLPAVGSGELYTDPIKLRNLVTTITASLGLAFYTSIAGISLSILFLFSDRLVIHAVENKISKLSEIVRVAYPVITRDEVLRIQHSLVEDASKNIQTLGTDISTALVSVLEPSLSRAMQEHVAPAMQGIQEAVEKLVTFSSEGQIQGVQKLVDRFMDSMHSALGGQFEDLRGVLDSTIESQRSIGAGLEQFNRELRETVQVQNSLIRETTRAAETLTSSLDRLETISFMLTQAAEKVTDAGAQLERSASSALQAQEAAVAAQKELLTSAQEHSQAMSRARQELSDAWESAVSQANGTIHQIQEATRELSEGIGNQLVNALKAFDGALGETIERFSGTLAQLDGSIGELPPAAQSVKESCELMAQNSSDILGTVDKLNQLVSGIITERVTEALSAADKLTHVAESARDISAGTEELRKEFSKTVSELSSVSKELQQLKGDFGGLEPALKQILAGVTPLQQSLTSISAALDGGNRMSILAERLNELSQNLTGLRSAIGGAAQEQKPRSRFRLFGGRV